MSLLLTKQRHQYRGFPRSGRSNDEVDSTVLEDNFFSDAKNEVSLILAGSEGSVVIRAPSERSFPDSDNLGIDIRWSNNNCLSCAVFFVTVSVKELRLK